MILLFGFSANPPHRGHLDVITQAIDAHPGEVSEIIVVPCRKHPFGKALNNFGVVSQLTEAFAKDVECETSIKASFVDIEGSFMALTKKDICYSADVVKMLNISRNCSEGILMCYGSDNKENFHLFFGKEYLEKSTTLFFAQSRLDIRSTKIRQEIKNGRLPTNMLTKRVHACIEKLPKNTFNMGAVK